MFSFTCFGKRHWLSCVRVQLFIWMLQKQLHLRSVGACGKSEGQGIHIAMQQQRVLPSQGMWWGCEVATSEGVVHQLTSHLHPIQHNESEEAECCRGQQPGQKANQVKPSIATLGQRQLDALDALEAAKTRAGHGGTLRSLELRRSPHLDARKRSAEIHKVDCQCSSQR